MNISKTYAKSLYETILETKVTSIQDAMDQLMSFRKEMDHSKDLNAALLSPVISAKEKTDVVQALASRLGASPTVSRFLTLVAQKDRFAYLGSIIDALEEVRILSEGGTVGTIVSADPLGPGDIRDLSEAFSKKLGKRVGLRVETDPGLLAGIKVTVNGVTYDGTLRSQLNRLRETLVSDDKSVH